MWNNFLGGKDFLKSLELTPFLWNDAAKWKQDSRRCFKHKGKNKVGIVLCHSRFL